jgi:hypothetical protein
MTEESIRLKPLTPDCKGETTMQIEFRRTDTLCPYARNPRRNDHAVDQMIASIREYGFKIPLLVRSDGEVVDGHLRLKAARILQLEQLPVILCDEWTPAQVKAFRLLVNRSASWADWDEELLAFELQELNAMQFDLSLTGFDLKEIDDLLIATDEDDQDNATPPLPETPVTREGDLWVCGPHRVLCGDATSQQAVGRLLGASQPHPAGERPSLWDRTRFGMARPCRAERLRARPGERHEAAHRRPH